MKTILSLILTMILLSSCISKEERISENKSEPPGATITGKSGNYSDKPSTELGIPVLGGSVERTPPQ